jgi:hypothetical protein
MRSDSGARRGLRALVAVTVTSLTLGGALATSATAAPSANLQRARLGAQWLANQIKQNGGYVENFGVADPSSTAYAVIAMRAAGVDKPASDQAIRYLSTKIGTQVQLGGEDAPGALAYYILAAVADKKSARRFGGTNPQNNLVDRLLATARTTGPDTGLFGVQDPTYDGAFRQGLALAALKAARVAGDDPRVAAAVAWITQQQCANGLWQAYRPDPATACWPANPSNFTGPDTNSTSLAVQGLAAWGAHPKRALVLQSLDMVQSANGGFPYIAAPNQAADPNSTALVTQTLIAEGTSPTAAMWAKGVDTPFTALASYQLGRAQPGYGAFRYPPSTAPDVFATVQAVPAMAGKTLPVLRPGRRSFPHAVLTGRNG